MNNNPLIVTTPKHTIIEKTALEFAATFYETARSQGIDISQYKNAKQYAIKHFPKFIPRAIYILTDMLSNDNVAEHLKLEIYEALMERNNDARVEAIQNRVPMLDAKKLLDETPIPPVILNTEKFDPDNEKRLLNYAKE